MQDEELLMRIEQQDQAALALLYERYSTPVYSLAYRILGSTELAEEAMQDTFMKVWRLSSRWDPAKGRFSSWLLTITRYTAIDLLRTEQRQATPEASGLDNVTPPADDTARPDDPLLHDGRMLRELMTRLPFEQSQAIQMAFFQGLTHRELAERLNLPLGTVKTRVRLGLQKLKSLWTETTETQESN